MPGLVIKLDPHERFYINGAMIQNGPRRSELCLPMKDTEFLRERDIIAAPSGADMLSAACILAQDALMDRSGRQALVKRLEAQVAALLRDPAHRMDPHLIEAARRLSDGSVSGTHYLLLRAVRARDRTRSEDGTGAAAAGRKQPGCDARGSIAASGRCT